MLVSCEFGKEQGFQHVIHCTRAYEDHPPIRFRHHFPEQIIDASVNLAITFWVWRGDRFGRHINSFCVHIVPHSGLLTSGPP